MWFCSGEKCQPQLVGASGKSYTTCHWGARVCARGQKEGALGLTSDSEAAMIRYSWQTAVQSGE